MSEPFQLPSGDKLSAVDPAACEYSTELVEVEGVVSPSSQSGWPGTEGYTVHMFSLAAWRVMGEPLCRDTLLLLRPVPVAAEYFREFSAGTLHRFEVLLSADQTRAVVSKLVQQNIENSELASVAEELEQPVVIKTKLFGDLTLNRSIGCFEGLAVWNGIEVELSLDSDKGLDIASQLKTAESLFREEAEWQRKIEAFAVAEKLELANDWQEVGKTMDPEEFLDRMELESISIGPDGEFEFWHDDGDIFYGHSIQISGSLSEGLTDSDIPG